jgi:hypothetical protein
MKLAHYVTFTDKACTNDDTRMPKQVANKLEKKSFRLAISCVDGYNE